MNSPLNHVLLTRFNLPSRGAESYIRARENWLRFRIELFERYCLPSVLSQSVENINWIIYLDPASPDWLVDRMTKLAEGGAFVPIYREEVPREALLSDIQSVVHQQSDWLITTNLDNDDGLAIDFAERIQSLAVGKSRRAIYVDNGIILSAAGIFLRRDAHNAFCSVAEPWDSPVTCWSAWHNELSRTMPVAHVAGQPAWLQVVHSDNVSNRVRGRLVPAGQYRTRFPGLIDDVGDPSNRDILADRLVRSPARAIREGARQTAKSTLLAVAGRAGLEGVHQRWNALRSRI